MHQTVARCTIRTGREPRSRSRTPRLAPPSSPPVSFSHSSMPRAGSRGVHSTGTLRATAHSGSHSGTGPLGPANGEQWHAAQRQGEQHDTYNEQEVTREKTHNG